MWASTLCPFSSSTRNMAFGNGSTTVPSTRIVSSLGFAREHHLQGWKRASGLGNSVTIAAELLGPLGARNGQGADRRDYLIGVVPAKPVPEPQAGARTVRARPAPPATEESERWGRRR